MGEKGIPPAMEAGGTNPLDAARVARVTQNEALFREVNEQIDALNDFGAHLETFGVVCECGEVTCSDVITTRRSIYEGVRAFPERFIVRAGHVFPDVESVVETHDDFVVVAKNPGIAERLAEETDPRS